MKAEYRRDLQHNYLILQAEEEEEDNYQLRMAQQNEITGLLPFHCARKNGELQFYYEITARQSVSSLYEKRMMSCQDILLLLGGIRDTMENLQKYLLNPLQLVFYPEYVYMDAERRTIFLCYFAGAERESSILDLAEFILKHLDHEDRCAVVLGYNFYQKASEENFSLYKTLKELLLEIRGEEAKSLPRAEQPQREDENTDGWDVSGREYGEPHKEYRKEYDKPYKDGTKEITKEREYDTEMYDVVHKSRSRKNQKDKRNGIIDRLFRIIHPAVLVSGLFLFAVLEIVYYIGGLGLTEAGGVFFLIISVEMLLNRYLLGREKKREKTKWEQEEENETYRILKEEMYEMPQEEERIAETQYLNRFSGENSLRLISVYADGGSAGFPDICLNRPTVCVGKIKGEADVILDSPTVSRVHARLEAVDGRFFVKDLNSRNGTFHNGRRLEPQERCEIEAGDRISFAEAEYQAVRM